ncbi:MAG: methyl-accepting chemotaxis protein [Pseudomonadota bacterium]
MQFLTSTAGDSLAPLQRQTAKGLAYAMWLHVPLAIALGVYVGSPNLIAGIVISGALAGAATTAVTLAPSSTSTRCAIAASYMMQAATFVFICSGHAWQIDMHMYFFAALAISVATFDTKAVLTAAAVTALHHLVLNFLAPVWVFPGGADLARVLLHAVIVVAQTAALLTLIYKLHQSVSTAADKSAEALRAQESLRQDDIERQAMVNELGEALAGLAAGNLTTRLENEFTEQYEQLRLDFNRSLHTLDRMISDVIGEISGIHGSIGEINQAADTLSSRTENQAASLEETAAALDEITVTVENTAKGTKEANDLVGSTHSRAEQSGEVVKDAVSAMGKIEKSSDKIAEVVGVIDEIAFQTNLLALNAGVEAARAGNAGKGFAVVATEVRTLAQRSSDAAREIKEIIAASRSQVAQGVDLVGRAGGELDEIVGHVTTFSQLVGEITRATQEQATALTEVNSAVNQMNQLTQHNAAMAEETTAASHVLSGAADHLSGIVQRFTISTHQPTARADFAEPLKRSA